MIKTLYGGIGEYQKGINSVNSTNAGSIMPLINGTLIGFVLDVILDETSEYYDPSKGQIIGCVRLKLLPGDVNKSEDNITTFAQPLDRSNYRLPLPGEQVLCIQSYGSSQNGFKPILSYYEIVTTYQTISSNIEPFLGGTDGETRNLISKLTDSLTLNVFANRFDYSHNMDVVKTKTSIEKTREGDKILEGRYGGVIKFTSTVEKDSTQRKIFPTAGSTDGDPLLIIKNNRKQSQKALTYTDDELNRDDVGIYLTTSQKLPISLGCSKKLYTWNGNKVAGINPNSFYDSLNKGIQARAQELAKQLPQQTTVLQTQATTVNELNTGTNITSVQILPTDADLQNAYSGGMLSRYLSYDVAVASPTAQSYNIQNKPGDLELKNIVGIATNVYDRLCDHFGIKIVVSSCFRSKALNTAIGGAITSQHTLGEALDLDVNKLNNPNITNRDVFLYIAKNLDYDQLIWELGDDNQPNWVHVSYGVTKQTQRRQILKFQGKSASPQYAQVNGNSTLEKQLGLA